MSGRRVLVTGASSGIGEATARLLALADAEVILISENEEELRRVGEEILALECRAETVVVDLTRREQVEGLLERLEREFGPIDTLINNAGVGLNSSVIETQDEDLRLLFEVNFFALHSLCRQALGRMADRHTGTIVNVTSASARLGSPGISAYSATKGAVHAFTQALRIEAAKYNVSVCECLPISVRTPFFDRARGRSYQPTGIVQGADTVARAIVNGVGVGRPPAEILPFRPIRAMFVLEALLPWLPGAIHLKR